ncbi:MAG: homoserine dehydrogenase [Lachnospiraceae bacterium]
MQNDRVIRVALLGIGTVGGGVVKLIERQKEEIPLKTGAFVEIAKVLVRDVTKKREGISQELLTNQWKDIIEDETIDIVVEVMGGIEPARTYILEALKAGKNVVTANKDLIAEYGHEILDTAKENGCDLMFEAAVAGGIPIIRPLKQCLAGNHIEEVMGIINGTTNYILTKMTEEGMEFSEALAMATELGYAEADPTADIEGLDAGRKIAIMASSAFNTRVKFSDVYTEGITKITSKDIEYAKEMDCVIKLLGVARNTSTGVEARVHPMLIPNTHPLATVRDSFNAVFVHGDAVGDTMFYGRGAGELPTASAIMGDIIDTVRNMMMECCGRIPCTCYKELPMKKVGDIESRYFIRIEVEDRAGVLATVASVLGNNNVSIAKVVQKVRKGGYAEIVVITDLAFEKNIKDAMIIFDGMSMIKQINSLIRVYE